MSADDVVFTGWLTKSPPEKKLNTRYSWRKRWFVLRQGRMSGNPDVLEYYRNKGSKKPIRTIDLQECEVRMPCELQQLHKRQFQNHHLFMVKTATRVFYLLAKTQEEMNHWVQSISQICTFGPPDDTDSAESLSHTPTPEQPSPAPSPRVSLTTSTDFIPNGSTAGRDRTSLSDSNPPPDYLILSQCNSGTISITRCSSFTNSELSLEQSSSEMVVEDVFLPTLPASGPPSSASPLLLGRALDTPFSAPCGQPPLCSSSATSSPRSLQQMPDIFRFDSPFCPSFDTHVSYTPPPLPPKPTNLSDILGHPFAPPAPLRHRVSMPSLDLSWMGESDSSVRRRIKLASLHLSSLAGGATLPCQSDDSYVPMASPPATTVDMPTDGYIPMSPSMFPRTNGKVEAPPPPGADLEPPPVNRDLKPRRRARPPPLDLRGLSTIREHPCHLPLVRTHTEPSAVQPCVTSDRRWRAFNPADPEAFSTPTDRLFFPVAESAPQQPWMRCSRLDYLSLDFNSASPSPVLKKPLLADDHKVDYVQVDEKKTQALQNTKLEWKDVRQSQA
ncbi:GRB2-associated-binding protein 3 [Clupea harengus]|uniref:GRB2-associated-binding protein 3 n=1 Tax=Clupea harengus TaxID=7950 RepID=A0A6P3VMD7_CLUHA|nr:GRB2-associated-binding protein 3 [Clupea harengus]